jgi:N-acetylneuraminic acid mutarotase
MRALTLLACLSFSASAFAADNKYPDLPKAFSSFGAVVVGDDVYVYGGHAGKAHSYSLETTLGDFRRLNLKNPTRWEELPAGPPVQGTAVVAHGTKIYRIGGMQPQNSKQGKTNIISLASVSAFDVKEGKWADIAPLPEARSSHDAVVVGDTLLVFGGWQLKGSSKESEWLNHGVSLDLTNPQAKWEVIKQPFSRRALTMASFDGKAYVIGGMGANGMEQTVNIYDPKSKEWSTGPTVPGGKMNGFTASSAVANGNLYLTPYDGKVFRLSAKKDAWEEVGKLEQSRFVARMVAGAKDTLVVIAGASQDGMLANLEGVNIK